MLSLEWLHANYNGHTNVGFRELIQELASAPNESLFGTDLIVTLVEHFWDYYYKRIFIMGFVPYIVYFVCTIIYASTFAVAEGGIPEKEIWAATPEHFMRWVILLSVFYFVFFELVVMLRDGWGYLTDIFNYFDWVAYGLNFYSLYSTIF